MKLSDLGNLVKQKYQQYSQINPVDLAMRVINKFPTYRQRVTDFSEQVTQSLQSLRTEASRQLNEFNTMQTNAQKYNTTVPFEPILQRLGTQKPQLPDTVQSITGKLVDMTGIGATPEYLQNPLQDLGVDTEQNIVRDMVSGMARSMVETPLDVVSARDKLKTGEELSDQEANALREFNIQTVAGLVDPIKSGKTTKLKPPDPLEALKVEARKYKSAEEFITSQGRDTLSDIAKARKSFQIEIDKVKQGVGEMGSKIPKSRINERVKALEGQLKIYDRYEVEAKKLTDLFNQSQLPKSGVGLDL